MHIPTAMPFTLPYVVLYPNLYAVSKLFQFVCVIGLSVLKHEDMDLMHLF